MRFPLLSLLPALLLPSGLVAGDLPTIKATLPDIAVAKNAIIPPVNLENHFEVTGITGTPGRVVQMRFVYGPTATTGTVNVELDPAFAPNTVTNFLNYVNSGRYTNTAVHRSVAFTPTVGYGIIQGGSFVAPPMTPVSIDPAIVREYNLPNARGTIAMALSSINNVTQPDSATSGWFFNVSDNSTVFGPLNQGGYAAFGRVTGTGMTVVDAINALPIYQVTFNSGALTLDQMPLAGLSNPPVYQNSNAVVLTSATAATVMPTTLAVNVTSSSTTHKSVTVNNPPAGFGTGSKLLGSAVTSVLGNFVSLQDNANETINTLTLVPTTVAGEKSVVTFSIENTNPSLLPATVTGAELIFLLKENRGGFANLVAKATDSNGNVAQIPFRVTVTGGNTTPIDLNNDAIDDLLFQNSIGQIAGWFLDGSASAVNFTTGSGLKPGSKTLYSSALSGWKVVGVSDINSDGFADLVFQSTTGQIAAWFLDGSGNAVNFTTGAGLKPGSKTLYSGALSGWKVVGIGDLNSDGTADIVFQNSIGQVAVWFLDGSGNAVNFATGSGLKPGSKTLYSPSLGSWKVAGIGDINSDNIADLVFQNSIGQIAAWYLDGSGNAVDFTTGSGLKPGSKTLHSGNLGDWRVVTCADLNKDGISDLVFQNTSGQVVGWLMDGAGGKIGSVTIYGSSLGSWRLF